MSLDLNKLENKLDEALSNETSETLTKFLNDKRMTNNKQQTAVDWQFDQLSIENLLGIFTHDQLTRVMEILEQAKAMQKQQAEHYATFITNCVINNLPTITFNDWINLHNNEQQ